MKYRRQLIDEQFEPLDLYYAEQTAKFDTNDVDLVDKAERYMEEALTGKYAKRMARYDTSLEIQKLIRFVDWAIKRGGDAFNQIKHKPIEQCSEEELEMRKPFWTRTYYTGKQEFRFDRKFINEYMQRVDVFVKDNQQAYHDYKKRSLFPKISDKTQAFQQSKGETGEEVGFVEYEEGKIREMYDIFRVVCLQVRQDSYELRRMPQKEQEFFVKLYRTLNKMLVYMESKNVKMVDSQDVVKLQKKKIETNEQQQDDDVSEPVEIIEKKPINKEDLMSLEQILSLPHVEKHI